MRVSESWSVFVLMAVVITATLLMITVALALLLLAAADPGELDDSDWAVTDDRAPVLDRAAPCPEDERHGVAPAGRTSEHNASRVIGRREEGRSRVVSGQSPES